MANTQNLDLVKPLGTDYALVSVLNSNSDKIDAYAGAVNASLDGLRDGLGVLADGNTHAAITSGQFVYVKNHQTLPQGLYQATTNIAANGTLSTSNLTADPKGGLNTLSEQIAKRVQVIPLKTSLQNFTSADETITFSGTLKDYDLILVECIVNYTQPNTIVIPLMKQDVAMPIRLFYFGSTTYYATSQAVFSTFNNTIKTTEAPTLLGYSTFGVGNIFGVKLV